MEQHPSVSSQGSSSGQKEEDQPFWEKWGRAWVCKIQLEQLKTDRQDPEIQLHSEGCRKYLIDETKEVET
jgi:hypothetical protein